MNCFRQNGKNQNLKMMNLKIIRRMQQPREKERICSIDTFKNGCYDFKSKH